jgi:hypothetical protein
MDRERPELCPIPNLCLAIRVDLKKGKVWKCIRARWKHFSSGKYGPKQLADQEMTGPLARHITLLFV